jgi:hypothetical protein
LVVEIQQEHHEHPPEAPTVTNLTPGEVSLTLQISLTIAQSLRIMSQHLNGDLKSPGSSLGDTLHRVISSSAMAGPRDH